MLVSLMPPLSYCQVAALVQEVSMLDDRQRLVQPCRHEATLGDGASEQVLSSVAHALCLSLVFNLQTLMSVQRSLASMLTLAKT